MQIELYDSLLFKTREKPLNILHFVEKTKTLKKKQFSNPGVNKHVKKISYK